MASNYPSNIDDFVNPTVNNNLDNPDHAAQHTKPRLPAALKV